MDMGAPDKKPASSECSIKKKSCQELSREKILEVGRRSIEIRTRVNSVCATNTMSAGALKKRNMKRSVREAHR